MMKHILTGIFTVFLAICPASTLLARDNVNVPKSIGKMVTLHGTAEDSKAGAGVLTDAKEFVYLEELASWPNDVRGKQVVVTGVLQQRKFIPDPVVGPKGEISQGAEGMQYTVKKARWKIAP